MDSTLSDRSYYGVYLLRLQDGSLYCGISNDVLKRVETHNAGKGSKYVKSRLPATLVHHEPGYTKSAALKREIEIKRMSRKEKLALIGESDGLQGNENASAVPD